MTLFFLSGRPGPESKVEQHLRKRVEKAGGWCLKFISTRAGVPDRIIALNGHTLFVEVKAPGKGRLSSLQRLWISRLIGAGADVRVVASIEEVEELLAELTTHHNQEGDPHGRA